MGWFKKVFRRMFPDTDEIMKRIFREISQAVEEVKVCSDTNLAEMTRMLKENNLETERKLHVLQNRLDSLEKKLGEADERANQKLDMTNQKLEMANQKLEMANKRIVEVRERFINACIREEVLKVQREYQVLQGEINLIKRKQEDVLGYVRENNWGLVFADTVRDSAWLTDQRFSLGRWAIGYQCAYVLFRVLDEMKPKHILELGLGQSTKFIGQYAQHEEQIEHIVIENDEEWIGFFQNNYQVSSSSIIQNCKYSFCEYEGSQVRVFSGLAQKLEGKAFDLIMIDAPIGDDMKEFSRIDVLLHLPECLEHSFVILLDDMNRKGEKNTFEQMKKVLEANQVNYAAGVYWGKKCVGVIVSPDLKYILTM